MYVSIILIYQNKHISLATLKGIIIFKEEITERGKELYFEFPVD